MFGTLRLPRDGIEDHERELYRSHFCTLCHSLDAWGGKLASLLTNYDVTFWMLSLTALEEASGAALPRQRKACTALPWRKVGVLELSPPSRQLTAALTLALAGAKVEDDRQDGDRPWVSWAFLPLRSSWQKALPWLERAHFPCEALVGLPAWQQQCEQSATSLPELCQPTQHAMECVFSHLALHCQQPQFREPLQRLGRGLGQWIYLYDALQDQLQDRRRQAFNALERFPLAGGQLCSRMLLALEHAAQAVLALPQGSQQELMLAQLSRLRSLTLQSLPAPTSLGGQLCWLGKDGPIAIQDCPCDCPGGDCPGCECPSCECPSCECPNCDCEGCDCDACELCEPCGECCEQPDPKRGGGWWETCCCCFWYKGGTTETRPKREEDPKMPGAKRKKRRWPWRRGRTQAQPPEPKPEPENGKGE